MHQSEDQGQYEHQATSGRKGMKRLLVLILVWALLVVTGTIVSADGQTRHRHKSKFGHKARTAAMIAGGAELKLLNLDKRIE